MSRYRRDYTPGAAYFFTGVTFRRRAFLCDADVREALRASIQRTRQKWPFGIDAWVFLPEPLHCLWTLPPGVAKYLVSENLAYFREWHFEIFQ